MSDSSARYAYLLALSGFALLVLAPAAGAQTIVLNGPLAQPASGDVFWPFGFTGDEKFVVYRADQEQDQLFGLYAARLGSKDPALTLHVPPTAADGIFGFATGPGDLVFFRARNEATGEVEIRGMSVEGASPPVGIGGGFPSGTELWPMMVSEPAGRIVFGAQLPGQSWYGVHSAPYDGSGVPAELTGSPSDMVLTPDGMHIVFLGSTGGEEMFIVPIDGSEFPRWLAAPLGPPGAYISFLYGLRLTADGGHVLYYNWVQGGGPDVVDLYSRSLTGFGGAKLNLASRESTFGYAISPRGDRILLREPGPTLDSVAVDGSGRVSLHAPGELPGGSVISPDGDHVALVVSGSLKRVAIDGSEPPLTLAPPECSVFGIEPSSSTVLFMRRDPATSASGLYAMPFDGSAPPTQLDVLTRPTQDTRGVWISSSPARLIYKTDRTLDEQFELYSVSLDGSAPPRRLNGSLSSNGDVDTVIPCPDGKRIVFLADERDEVFELFEVPVDGSAKPRRLNGELAGGPVLGDVTAFRVAPGGEEIVYRADQESDEAFDLYTVRADGSLGERGLTTGLPGSAVPLSFAAGPGGRTVFALRSGTNVHELCAVPTRGGSQAVRLDVGSLEFQPPFVFAPDGKSVAYLKRRSTVEAVLRVAPLDGSTSPVTLASPAPNRSVVDFRIEGRTVLFRADLEVDNRFELYRVPLDGSLAPVRLNSGLGTGQNVTGFEVSTEGRVVYLADQDINDRFELYTVSLNGRPAPAQLSPEPGSGGTVTHFASTPDEKSVVYRARTATGGRFDLFRVPVDRPEAVPLTAGGTHAPLGDFRFAADGRNVVYRATPPALEAELFRVPLDASAPPQRLSGTLILRGGVSSFALSPDGRRVVYLADQTRDGVLELFTVELLGGPVRAVEPLPAFADVEAYRITPDSRHVVYLADRDVDRRLELFAAPLDGSVPPRRVNGPLPAGALVQEDFSLLTGGRIVYRADQETRNAFQLYLGFVEEPAVRPAITPRSLVPRND